MLARYRNQCEDIRKRTSIGWILLPVACLIIILYTLLSRSSNDNLPLDAAIGNGDFFTSKMIRPSSHLASYRSKHFTPFLTCKRNRAQTRLLCALTDSAYCKTSEPAEVIEDLWVIAPIYSYYQKDMRYLYWLHENFKNYVNSFGVPFCTIEAINKNLNQQYLVTEPNKEPYDIQVQYYDLIYVRENLLNVAIKKLPPTWQYVSWIDAHQVFTNMYWWEESIVLAEKIAVLQTFRTTARMDLRNGTMRVKFGIQPIAAVQTDLERDNYFYEYGNGYVLRRELYDKIGSILDTCIASRCDLSYVLSSINPNTTYFSLLYRDSKLQSSQYEPWINTTRKIFDYSRGYIRGQLAHFEHGRVARYYDMLTDKFQENNLNIKEDLGRDELGTIYLKNQKVKDAIGTIQSRFYYEGEPVSNLTIIYPN